MAFLYLTGLLQGQRQVRPSLLIGRQQCRHQAHVFDPLVGGTSTGEDDTEVFVVVDVKLADKIELGAINDRKQRRHSV